MLNQEKLAPRAIRLGSPEDYVEALLPKALDRFSSLWPQVEVNVICDTSEALHQRIDDRQVDLVIVTPGKKNSCDGGVAAGAAGLGGFT